MSGNATRRLFFVGILFVACGFTCASRSSADPPSIVPDYEGSWRGDWRVTACNSDGDWRRMGGCTVLYPVGSVWAIALVVAQTSDSISGTLDFGDNMPGPVTAPIAGNGHLVMNALYAFVNQGVSVEISVSDWDTMLADDQRLTGRFHLTLRMPRIHGSVSTDGELVVVARNAVPATPAPRGVVHAFIDRVAASRSFTD